MYPYIPLALSSDASYADLPLTLLGAPDHCLLAPVSIWALLKAPVSIWALLKPGSLSLGKAKTETGRAALPGQDHTDVYSSYQLVQ